VNNPIILGRFNYLTVRAELYNVVFFPFTGTHAAVIARDLNKTDALNLVNDLNGGIDDTRKDLAETDLIDDSEM
jgi:hypothetical protein